MRPKSIGGSGSVMKSPISASGLRRCASCERDLRRLVLDRLGHLAKAQQPDLAVAAVDLGADVVFLAVFRAAGLLDRLLHRLEHLVAVDALVAGDGVGDLQQLGAGVGDGAFHGLSERLFSGVRVSAARDRAAAIRSSVRTSLARATAASGSRASPASVARRISPSAVPSRRPRKRLRPSTGCAQLDLGLETAEAVVILGPHQRPVDAGRADFERVGAGDRVGDIEQRRNRVADRGAILDRHRRVVDPLGHDLQGRAAPAGDDDPHDAITHRRQRRLDHLRDAVGIDQKPDLCSRPCLAPIRKSGPRPTLRHSPQRGPMRLLNRI